ncbi:hypothetical protein Slin15195_G091580 [Septoria linicola]|uniref:Uncharacterized protein n=1 Tax=Septoria linicola TaxID=215465 RepID=A0A9Q9AVV6_9PEZI|nr:hypothetical protein Slin15195_G091580 [Septoria linicola]
MCATTPTDTITHYGKGAAITAYAGTEYKGPDPVNCAKTAVVDGHTFTSGTAYISIKRVSAVDRCTKTFGSVISDAILAMLSESVLSLRYRQNHHQRFMETDKVTGYPVRYQDFNTPIPWSAWIGQNRCDIGIDEYRCGVIYENDYRPQLAIPPEITSLSPDFEDCEMWYNGLFDPPLALNEHSVAAGPTRPGAPQYTTEPASPSSTVVAPAITATKLANEVSTAAHASGYPVNQPEVSHSPNGGPTQPTVDDGTTVIGGHSSSNQVQQSQESHAQDDGPTIPAVGVTSSTTVIEHSSPDTSDAASDTDLQSAEGSSAPNVASYESQTAVGDGPETTAESISGDSEQAQLSTTVLPASSNTRSTTANQATGGAMSSTPVAQARGGATESTSTARNSILLISFVFALALA